MNRVIETQDGFDCIVEGQRFGSWRSRAEAAAGMVTEVARHEVREKAESQRLMAQTDAATQDYHEWRNQK